MLLVNEMKQLYRCMVCGNIFDEPLTYTEPRWHDMDEPRDEYKGCPECHGDYEEVYTTGDCIHDGC